MRALPLLPLPLTLALGACFGDDAIAVSDSQTEATTGGPTTTLDPSATETVGPTTITTIDTVTATDPTAPTTGEPGVCGNGVIEPGEMCDDGNNAGGDGCEGDCTLLAGERWWQEVVDGGDMDLDRGDGVATDAAGNIYVIGTTVDPFTKSDIFIRKYDPIGVSIWTRTYDGGADQNDVGAAIAGDAAGFMVVAGRQTLQGAMTSVVWLSKCDPNGQILWQTTEDAATSVVGLAMFSNTHFIAVGSVKEGNDTNLLIRRYDGEASPLWTTTFAGADGGPDSAAAVAVDGAGDLFIAGREFTDATSFNAWFARYDASGAEVWTKTVDGPLSGADWASAIAVSDEGWLVVGGRQDGGAASLGDAWLARYTVDGDELWSEVEDGPGNADDGVSGLAIDGQGAIIAVGRRSALGQGTDLWIRKHDGGGGELWTRTIDGPASADDEAVAVAVDDGDNVVTVGTLTIIDKFDSDIFLSKHAP